MITLSFCYSLSAQNYSVKIYLCSPNIDEFQKEINSTSQDVVDRLGSSVIFSFDISDNQRVKFSKESFLQKVPGSGNLSENSAELPKNLPKLGIELSVYFRNLKKNGEIAIELDLYILSF